MTALSSQWSQRVLSGREATTSSTPHPHSRAPPARRRVCSPVAVGWDPEGILAAPRGDHIGRRSLQKELAANKELAAEADREREKARKALQEAREARPQPTTHAQLLEYFLATERAEMEFEAARCRPLLTPDFFQFLKAELSNEKFGPNPRPARADDLEALQGFLEAAVAGLDATVASAASPADRMRRLLSSPDKRAELLEMAGNNEIDQALLDLLQRNIEAARASGQEDPARFMEKVRTAAARYVMSK